MSYPLFAQTPSNELMPGTGIYVDYNYPASSPQFSMGDQISSVGDYVWDGVSGVWVNIKNELKDVQNSALDSVDSILGLGMKYILMLVAGVAVLIWVLGKSGTKFAIPGLSVG